MHQLLITIGIFTSQALTTAKFELFGSDALWQYSLLVPVGCSLLQLCLLPLFGEESPAYLYRHHGRARARAALEWFRLGRRASSSKKGVCKGARGAGRLERFLEQELDDIAEELRGSDSTATPPRGKSASRRMTSCNPSPMPAGDGGAGALLSSAMMSAPLLPNDALAEAEERGGAVEATQTPGRPLKIVSADYISRE